MYEFRHDSVDKHCSSLFYYDVVSRYIHTHCAFHAKLGLNGRRKDELLQAATSDRQLLDQK
jgi:hypothetical protein